MEQRIHNLEHVGSVLQNALRAINAKKQEKRTAALSAPQHFVQRDTKRLPLRVAMKRRSLSARGSGIYEDNNNGDIWFRDGEFLVKQANIDVSGIVEKYLDSCKGS